MGRPKVLSVMKQSQRTGSKGAQVVLMSPDRRSWELQVGGDQIPMWLESSRGATADVIIQRDFKNNRYYKWSIDNNGVWVPVPIPNHTIKSETVVYLLAETFTGFVFTRDSNLVAAAVLPEGLTDAIHGDGTEEEVALREAYTLYNEQPADGLEAYVSDDAYTTETPPDNLNFQNSPEDELQTIPTSHDGYGSHLPLHMGGEAVSGFTGDNSYLDADGQTHTTDVRMRHAGIDAALVEPVISGALNYDHPIRFLNYHGVHAWRRRSDNAAFVSTYTYATTDPALGGTLHTVALGGDGPIEGSPIGPVPFFDEILDEGHGCSPNLQVADPPITLAWSRSRTMVPDTIPTSSDVTDNGGYVKVENLAGTPLGAYVRIASPTYTALGRVTGDDGTLSLAFTEAVTNVGVAIRHGTFDLYACNTVRLFIENFGSAFTPYRIGYTQSDGETEVTISIGKVQPSAQIDRTITIPDGARGVFVETGGGSHRAQLDMISDDTLPIPDVDSGVAMWAGGSRDCLEVTIN